MNSSALGLMAAAALLCASPAAAQIAAAPPHVDSVPATPPATTGSAPVGSLAPQAVERVPGAPSFKRLFSDTATDFTRLASRDSARWLAIGTAAALGIIAGRTVTVGRGRSRMAVSPGATAGGAGVTFTLVGSR